IIVQQIREGRRARALKGWSDQGLAAPPLMSASECWPAAGGALQIAEVCCSGLLGRSALMSISHMPVGAKKKHDPERRRVHLEERLAKAEKAIVQAEKRIKSHSRLPAIDGEPWQKRLHADAHHNLLEGLKLLCLQRTMVLHELSGSRIPRRLVANKRERIGQ